MMSAKALVPLVIVACLLLTSKAADSGKQACGTTMLTMPARYACSAVGVPCTSAEGGSMMIFC